MYLLNAYMRSQNSKSVFRRDFIDSLNVSGYPKKRIGDLLSQALLMGKYLTQAETPQAHPTSGRSLHKITLTKEGRDLLANQAQEIGTLDQLVAEFEEQENNSDSKKKTKSSSKNLNVERMQPQQPDLDFSDLAGDMINRLAGVIQQNAQYRKIILDMLEVGASALGYSIDKSKNKDE